MAITSHTDLIEATGGQEVGGWLSSCRRKIVLANTDAWGTAAGAAIQAVLDDTNVPQAGDTLDADHPNLFCTTRDVTMNNSKRATVWCNYKFYATTLNSNVALDNIQTQLKTVTTELDRSGSEITVKHNTAVGHNETQVGEISALHPEGGFVREIVLSRTNDGAAQYDTMNSWINHINSDQWNFGEPGTWLCMDATPRPLQINPVGGGLAKWVFRFQFAYDSHGWKPWVFWIDKTTGRPPDGLSPGVGFKQVDHYPTKAFLVEP